MADAINRRERKKINSRKAIITAAVKLFAQKGYNETSIADIMNEADLGLGTFYNYFEAKEEILKYFLDEMISETNRAFMNLSQEVKTSPEILTEMFLLTARILDENRFVLPLFLNIANKGAAAHVPAHPVDRLTFKSIFDAIIKRGRQRGEFRQDIPAAVITEMFHSALQAAAFSRLEITFMENIKYKLTLILDGLTVKKP